MNPILDSIFLHRDGTVSIYDTRCDAWVRTRTPTPELLATLSDDDLRAVLKHLWSDDNGQ